MRGDSGFQHPQPDEKGQYLYQRMTVEPPKDGKSILECTAADLVRDHGESLVGRRVWTKPIGAWPGGLARVVELYHDENAPDILFQVEGLETNARYPEGEHGPDKVIGVFADETCYLLTETGAP